MITARRLRRLLLGTVVAAASLVAAAHLPPVRAWARAQLEARLSAALGAVVTVDGLEYNLLLLTFRADSVRMAPAGRATDAFLEIAAITSNLSAVGIARGRPLEAIEIVRPRIRVAGLRAWLAARPAGGAPLSQPLAIGRFAVRDLSITGGSDDSPEAIELRAMSIDLVPDGRGAISSAVRLGPGSSVRIRDATLPIASIDGRLAFDGARIRFDRLRVVSSDVTVAVTGWVHLVRTTKVQLELTSEVGAAWLARLGNLPPGVDGRLIARATLTGPASKLAGPFDLVSDAITLAGPTDIGLRVRGRLSPERVTIEALDAVAFDGRLGGSADVSFDGRGTTSRALLHWSEVDLRQAVAAWPGLPKVPLSTRLDGRAELTGAWHDPRSIRASVETTLRPAGGGVPVSGRLLADMEHGVWSARLNEATIGATSVSVSAGGRLGSVGSALCDATLTGGISAASAGLDRVAADLVTLGLADGPLAGIDGTLSSDLALSGTLGDPRATGRIEVHDGSLGGTSGLSTRADLAIDTRRISIPVLEVAQGGNRLSGTGFVAVFRTQALEGRFTAALVDLPAAAAAMPPAWRPVGGRAEIAGAIGGSVVRPRLDIDADLRDLAVAGQHASRLAVSLDVEAPSLRLTTFSAEAQGGSLNAAGQYDLRTGALLVERLSARSWPLSPITGPGVDVPLLDVTGLMNLEATGAGTAARPAGRAEVTVNDLTWDGIRLGQLVATLTARGDGSLDVAASVPAVGATIGGRITTASPYAFDAQLALSNATLSPALLRPDRANRLPKDTHANIDARIAARGSLAGHREVDLDIEMTRADVTARGVSISLARPARVELRGGEISRADAELTTGSSRLTLRCNDSTEPASLEIDGEVSDFGSSVPEVGGKPLEVHGRIRATIEVAGSLDAPQITGRLHLENGALQSPALPPVSDLALSASIGDGRLTLSRIDARSGDAGLVASAEAPLRFFDRFLPPGAARRLPAAAGPARVSATFTSVTEALLGRLVAQGALGNTAARFDGALDIEADYPTLASVRGDVRIERAEMLLGGLRLTQSSPAALIVRDGRAAIDAWRWTGAGTDILVGGRFALAQPRTHELSLGGTLDLRALGAVVPGRLAGTATLDLKSRSSGGPAQLTGRLELADGAWVDRTRQIALVDLEGVVQLTPDRVTVNSVTGRLNGGTFTAAGELGLAQGSPAGVIDVAIREAGIEFPSRAWHDLDADLHLRLGTTPSLDGHIAVTPGKVTESLVGLAKVAQQFSRDTLVPATPRRDQLTSRLMLDIALETTDDLVADSPDMRLQAGAALQVVGTLAQPVLRGRATIREGGELFLGGRTYEVQAGTIEFVEQSGGTGLRLGITAATQVSTYDVGLRITGEPAQLGVTLNSNPPLGQSDLVSLLTTGRTGASSGTDPAGVGVAALFSAEILGGLGRTVGLDTVRIEQQETDLSTIDLEPVARLTASKRLSAQFELIYSQNLSESDDLSWILLYEPGWRRLETRATYRTRGAESIEVRQEVEFGGKASSPAPRRRRPTGPRIAEVRVTGVPDAEAVRLRRLLRARPGKRFDAQVWQRDEERLLRDFQEHERLLARVRSTRGASPDGHLFLVFDVTPGPLTRLVVQGHEPSPATLDAMREAWAAAPFDDLLAEELGEPLRVELAGGGYLRPEISVTLRKLDAADGREAVVSVAPGPRTARRDYQFSDGSAVRPAELERVVSEARLDARCWIDPAVVEAPIRALLAARGHLAARVIAGRPRFDGDAAVLPVTIEEGPLYRIREIRVAGADGLGESAVLQALVLRPGASYEPAAVSRGLNGVRAAYYRSGFGAARVSATPRVDRDTATVRLDLVADEGRRNVLQEVAVNGGSTSRGLIDDALDLSTGTVAAPAALDRAQSRLYQTGIFQTVSATLEPVSPERSTPGIDQPVRAVFAVTEWPRYRLRYGVEVGPGAIEQLGLSTGEPVPGVTLDLQRRNLFGKGLSAGAGAFWATDRYRVRGTLSAPMFLGRFATTTLSADTSVQDLVFPSASGPDLHIKLDRSRNLLEQRWRRGTDRRVELAYGYQIEKQELTLSRGELEAGLVTWLSAFTGTLTLDTRDNVFNPRSGLFHSSWMQGGPQWLISDIAYARYLLQQYHFLPLGPIVLASAARFGTLDLDDENALVGLSLRFRTGGGSSVRGYAQDSLGPTNEFGVTLGGNVLLVLNEEVRFPIYRWFGGAVFLDAGNTFSGLDTLSLSGLEVGTGFGLRLNTPVAVIRVDLGFPVPRPQPGPLARWYFAIGQAF